MMSPFSRGIPGTLSNGHLVSLAVLEHALEPLLRSHSHYLSSSVLCWLMALGEAVNVNRRNWEWCVEVSDEDLFDATSVYELVQEVCYEISVH